MRFMEKFKVHPYLSCNLVMVFTPDSKLAREFLEIKIFQLRIK
jgi:hypothetical protein